MSRSDRLGALACFLAFVLICILALVLSTTGPFGGLQGLQEELANEAFALAPEGSNATADGQDITVTLPAIVQNDFDRAALQANVESIKGVRNVNVVGTPIIAGPDSNSEPDEEQATLEESPEPEIAEPEVTEPEETEPEAVADEATPEPETVPDEPTPEPEPEGRSIEDVLAGFDLGGVQFVPGTPQLTGVDEALLDTVAKQLINDVDNLAEVTIEVQAHTDNLGDPDVNQLLSEDRAQAVAGYLANSGVNAALIPRGYGGSTPIADNSTEQGREANQRVALVVEGN